MSLQEGKLSKYNVFTQHGQQLHQGNSARRQVHAQLSLQPLSDNMFASPPTPLPRAPQPFAPMQLAPPGPPNAQLPCTMGKMQQPNVMMGQSQTPIVQQPPPNGQEAWSACGAPNPRRPAWMIDRNNTDALTAFNGVLKHDRDWAAKFRGHVSED